MKIHTAEIAKISAKVLILLALIGNVVYELNTFYSGLPIPVAMVEKKTDDTRVTEMKDILTKLGCPSSKLQSMSTAIIKGADDINVDPKLIAALVRTESDFDMTAVSSKGYKGLMQTPVATKQWADVDILIGCKILQEKMGYAKGDMRHALALYKGGNNPMAKRQAEEVIALYKQIRNEG